MTTEHPATLENADMQSLKTLTTVVYGLQAIGLLGLFVPFLVGVVILFVNAVWIIYRIVKGWLNLNDGRPMYGSPA